MKPFFLIITVLHLARGASLPWMTCPDPCFCHVKNESVELACSSYEFIKKLTPKQITTIASLTMNNLSLVNVDPKLKYLKNLNHLDLSNNDITILPSQFPYLPKLKSLNLSRNHLKEAKLSDLPKNLEILDLSHNSFAHFPKDWTNLKYIKTLRFYNNPIDCDCNNLHIYEQILIEHVNLPENLTCHQPKEFQGRPLSSVNCSIITENLLNTMLGDEGGSGEKELDTPYYIDNYAPLVDDKEEFIEATHTQTNPEDNIGEEGSGEGEGSGYLIPIFPIPEVAPKACIVNCSTPKPVGAEDEKNASPPPTFKEQVGIVFNDIFGIDSTTTSSTTTPRPTESIKEVEEKPFIKESDKTEVETFPTNDTVYGEMERASMADSSSQTIYIVVGLLVAFVAFTIIYYINKRRKTSKADKRRRNKSNENGYGEELKPLGKSAEKQMQIKPSEKTNSKPPSIVEATPLLNGQNGKINEDTNVPKSKAIDENDTGEPEVEIRKPTKEELLTPQLERVTIKSGEIPDSIPKTPLLVHRQLNNDGEIVTTVISK